MAAAASGIPELDRDVGDVDLAMHQAKLEPPARMLGQRTT
jgi:hypothetical protein